MANPNIQQGLSENCLNNQTEYLAGKKLIICANRAPFQFEKNPDEEYIYERGSGGLVTALLGLTQNIDATWIACAQSSADRELGSVHVPLDPENPEHTIHIKFLSPTVEAYEGYYNVIANPLLWFLQHSMWNVPISPIIDRNTWHAWDNGYHAVNELFARAIIEETHKYPGTKLVMLQDYHLYLTARRVRDALPPRARPTLLHFIHIPWPGPEYWQILPPNMRFSILDSLCAVDILGFQTNADRLNFIRTCESFLPKSYVNFKHGRVWYRNHATYVRDFPISIDVDSIKNQVRSPEVEEYRSEIESNTAGFKVIVRVDRIEPSKNIVRGFLAFEELLDLHPEHCGKVHFLAYLVPSRLGVVEYNEYLDNLNATAGRVNAKYGDSDWEPVRIIIGENYDRALAALQLYDVLLVNAIADGMNLVAKEGPIVNQRDGVLILSERTGANQQLGVGAIVIPPCDVYATAEAIHQALIMPEVEKKGKAHLLKWIIEKEDIVDWLCRQLKTIEELGL